VKPTDSGDAIEHAREIAGDHDIEIEEENRRSLSQDVGNEHQQLGEHAVRPDRSVDRHIRDWARFDRVQKTAGLVRETQEAELSPAHLAFSGPVERVDVVGPVAIAPFQREDRGIGSDGCGVQ
jgi:hypothetical protein